MFIVGLCAVLLLAGYDARAGSGGRHVARRTELRHHRDARRRVVLSRRPRREARHSALAPWLHLSRSAAAARQSRHHSRRRARRSTRRGRSRGARWRACATTTTSCAVGVARDRPGRTAGSPSSFAPSTTASASATRFPPSRASRRLRDLGRAHRVRAGRRRARVVDPLEPAAAWTARKSSTPQRPVSTLDSVQTPLTIEMRDGRDRRDLTRRTSCDYAANEPRRTRMESRTLRAALAPWADGVKVRGRAPFVTPWRTIQLADRADGSRALRARPQPQSAERDRATRLDHADEVRRHLVGHAPQHDDVVVGPEARRDDGERATVHRLSPRRTAWRRAGGRMEHRMGRRLDREPERLLLHAVVSRLRSPGPSRHTRSRRASRLIVHNETSGGIENYERQMDSAFALYQSLGLDAIKTGYVTDHRRRRTVALRRSSWCATIGKVIETAARVRHHGGRARADARHRRAAHVAEHDESRRGARTGVQRVGRRRRKSAGARDDSLLHAHARRPDGLHAGHLRSPARARHGHAAHAWRSRASRTTLAKQLALYVVLYSPLQMAADLPENYAGQPAFQFIRDVAVDWDTTRVLDGKIGDYVARRAQERRGQDEWFVGAITDEEAHVRCAARLSLPGPKYVAEIYADGPGANWRTNPLPVTISSHPVTSATRLQDVGAGRRAGDTDSAGALTCVVRARGMRRSPSHARCCFRKC